MQWEHPLMQWDHHLQKWQLNLPAVIVMPRMVVIPSMVCYLITYLFTFKVMFGHLKLLFVTQYYILIIY